MAKGKHQAADRAAYKMPAVEVGDTVLWHDQQEAEPTAMAFVTAVGNDSISLAILGPGYQNFLVREGVRHRDFPDKEVVRLGDVGVWTHTARTLKLNALLEAFDSKPQPTEPRP